VGGGPGGEEGGHHAAVRKGSLGIGGAVLALGEEDGITTERWRRSDLEGGSGAFGGAESGPFFVGEGNVTPRFPALVALEAPMTAGGGAAMLISPGP